MDPLLLTNNLSRNVDLVAQMLELVANGQQIIAQNNWPGQYQGNTPAPRVLEDELAKC